jgi:succinate dehydrogenase / fumarate reductase flavoprotein subunit
LTVAEAITRSAIERKESRGAQFREDYPEKDTGFGKINMVVRKSRNGPMEVERVPVPEMPAELQAIIKENQ